METPLLKMDAIGRCLARVRDVSARDPSLSSLDVQDIVVLNLQRACEQTIDLANWTCAHLRLDVPRTSSEVFDILERNAILSSQTAGAMRRMVGFRNIAVHEYRKLNPRIVRAIVTTHLGDFERCVDEIGARLALQLPRASERRERRFLHLTVQRIFLTGDSLGDDFGITFEMFGRAVQVRFAIDSGETIEPLLPVGSFECGATRSAPLKVTIRESDPVADDVGTAEMTVILTDNDEQLVAIDVAVHGRGRGESKKLATMTLILRLSLHGGRVFVADVPPNGWLVGMADDGERLALPHALALELLSVDSGMNGRQHFRIAEGHAKDRLVSVGMLSDGSSPIVPVMPRFDAVRAKLDLGSLVLSIEEVGEFAVARFGDSEPPVGVHPLHVPDMPHAAGARYARRAPHAKSWFKIGVGTSRYLHAGAHSEGCVTVKDIGAWERIYHRLIFARLADGKVGTIEVS
jgi:uncharacterized protein YutE (UPF0331/DUF86 family)